MTPGRYAVRFAAAFLLLWLAVEVLRASPLEPLLLRVAFLEIAATLLGLSGASVEVIGRALLSADAQLRIVRGCEGAESLALLTAAIVALPRDVVRRRIMLLVAGLLLGWALCILRLLLLFLTLQHSPAHWELVHGFIAPLLPLTVLVLAFHLLTRPQPTDGTRHRHAS